ncbi:MAG: nucleoside:proton symporter [Proteobacteria bacterium]|nr:nucleoside:proton symporter [Pseudomonadota bacterium]
MVWQGVLGVFTLTALAWGLSEDRRRAPWKTVAAGLGLQFALALLLLKVPFSKQVFAWLNQAVLALQDAMRAGTSVVFGYLGGGQAPFAETFPGASFILAFQALPMILVISALSALLFYWKVLPVAVRGAAWVLERAFGIGGAVGVSAAANVFVGMVEAPLLVRPYLLALNRGELFMVMTCGMATVAGTVMVLYAAILAPVMPDAMGHVLAASLISAPAAIMVARLMVPGDAPSAGGAPITLPAPAGSAMDAITRGTMDGVTLLINVSAMLIVLVALVSLFNMVLGLLPELGGAPVTLERLLGYVMAPVVWLMGVPWSEAPTAGALMGTKTVLNELLAYLQMAKLPADALSPHSRLIMIYALCGFANFGSLGIMIGGLGTMVPERRGDIVALGMKSIVAGTIATCLTGAVAGIVA